MRRKLVAGNWKMHTTRASADALVRAFAAASLEGADLAVFPGIMLLRRALEKREAGELRSRFLPMETTYPALARWIGRVENLPGYDRTYPPHWREGAPRG